MVKHFINIYKIRTTFLNTKIKEWSGKNAKKKGYGMFKYYQENENAKKANTLAYHLLTALKNKDYNAFTATIIKVYASRYTPVPAFFVSSLSNKTAFEQYALAYIAGLIQKNN